MYDTWHWANQMMLMLIWHTVLLIVSGQRYKRQMLQKCPHCDSIVAICHAYGLRTVDISVTRLKWLQGKMQSLVAFSAEKNTNMQQTFWNAGIEEFDTGFLKDWKGWWSQSRNQPGKSFFFVKNSQQCFWFWELKIDWLRWQDLEDISLQISGAQCQLATCMDSTSPSTFRSSCLLSLWDDQLLGFWFSRGIFIARI